MKKSPWEDDSNDATDPFKKVRQKSYKINEFKMPDLFPFSPKNGVMVAVGAFCLWLSTGFYKVYEGEEAAVMRFGEYVRTASPGLNYHIPSPIENVIVEAVTKSRRIEIGYRSKSSGGNEATRLLQHESTMLTGDENIIDLNCDVMWHVKNLEDYIFKIASPEDSVKTAAESAIREVIGETPISSVLSSQKQEIADKIEALVQKTLDSYNSGIQIEMVQLLKAEPPAEVIDAYRDVQTSKADKEREINQAIAYNNDILPKARGESAKLIQIAEGYKQEVISKATGDTQRFLAIYSQYIAHKDITKNRLYLDVMEDVLKNATKYVVGNEMLPHMAIGQKGEKR